MMTVSDFLSICKRHGYTLFSGTPCSYLKPLINAVMDDPDIRFLTAFNEGDAVAMVCGTWIHGQKGVVMFQNSGLGNAVNALTSLAYPFRIPMLLVVTLRGEPGGPPDEPQHELMGRITTDLLELMGIPWSDMPDNPRELPPLFQRMDQEIIGCGRSFALVMRKGRITEQELKTPRRLQAIGKREFMFSEDLRLDYEQRFTRTDAIKTFLTHKQKKDLVIATTGKTGRELYTLEDSPQHLYMVGSMGSASSFGLGMALTLKQHRIVILDGDGALLMRLGNLANIGVYQPDNLLHILLDNEAHDSTGGQDTLSRTLSLAMVAQACGYQSVHATDCLEMLDRILLTDKGHNKGPVFVHFRIQKGSPKNLGRPKIKPFQVKERMMQFLGTIPPEFPGISA